ncbi:TIGR03013 family XrtA/PEP-CTERM system glycosyltransferase [Steroidobacter sp.]|uniref:TIGR03013 family XrtA/PEP-CTERM system glycosyltransferase n=1 Tax=Steroidobacter sp. TaxID=1978227 RepID=UPI001A532211|nr:TIGR03013 family XrtA/PEP-CTERM system glycosyltransferase [Steroidobacter sp.]MBL8266278.1 TIGR03013 family PEP-CTERM/XrtA system glycosyltransferase [Steroidobacter sp.]
MAIRIFQHYWHLHLALLAAIEGVIFFFAPYAAAILRFDSQPLAEQMLGPMLPRGVVFSGVLFISLAAMGLYNSRQRSRLAGLIARVAASVLAGAMLITILFYLFPDLHIGRGALLISLVIAFSGSVISRIVFDTLVDEDLFKRRVLVYGSGRRAASIARLRRRSDRRGFVVTGYVAAEGDESSEVPENEKLPTTVDLLSLCERYRVDEIVVAMDDRRRRFPMDQLLECRLEGVEILELVSFLERETGKVRLDLLNPSWMIFSAGFGRGRIHDTLERAFDIVASLILLVVAAPLMVLTALAIKILEGPKASIFYGQVRVGQYGRPFRLLKFRSMREDAEKNGAQWAQKNDSRVTPIGAFTRLTRIDELPQILNVLRGEMSFVGPRPERPEFVGQLEERIPYYRERHTIKPGITGWAQLCYPYGSSEQDAIEKLQYDLFYVKNHSLLFYLAILVQTVEVIVWRKGAR